MLTLDALSDTLSRLMRGRSHMGYSEPTPFNVFTTTSMDSAQKNILIKHCPPELGRTVEFWRLRAESKHTQTIERKNDVKSTIGHSEKPGPEGKEKSVVQTQSMKKLIKQQFCRRVSEIALGHCFTVNKNCGNATKPSHLILTQFIKRITYRRHGRHFFSVLLRGDESSTEHCEHDPWKEYGIKWEWGVRKIHFLQESLLILGEMNLRTTVTLFCMKRIYKKQVSNVSCVPWRWDKTQSV